MSQFNIYMTGVGGQGIGLLSELLLRAADHAGLPVKGVDTHGLAQRGGVVVSQVRMGAGVFSPLIPAGRADLVVALERHEALRGVNTALKDGGALVFYDTVWQPLDVRLGQTDPLPEAVLQQAISRRHIRAVRVFDPDLADARMQNVIVLAAIDRGRLVPDIQTDHYRAAMEDLMDGTMLSRNIALFESRRSA